MAEENEIIFHLGGTVTLKEFTVAVAAFRKLVTAAERQVAKGASIQWEITDLQPGSATIVMAGRATGKRAPVDSVGLVNRRLKGVATNYRRNRLTEMTTQERARMDDLAALVNGAIREVRIHTAEGAETITRVAQKVGEVATPESVPEDRGPVLGSVVGFVSTLSSVEAGLRFTLKDRRTGRSVFCYFSPEFKEKARNSWDGLVRVEGLVVRDSQTGDASEVRKVSRIEAIAPMGPHGYREARGAIRHLKSVMTSEEAVRRVRDAQEG
jgi:hypothetical protein